MTEDSVIFTPEKSKKIALARLDLLNQWKEFRIKSDNKLQADYDFVNLHNTSNSHLFDILGKISRGTLHRWKNILNGTEDYTKLIPQYRYAKVDEYRTCLTDEEIKIFMGLLLHPNRLCIGKATALTKYKLQQQGQSYIPADITFRKYANWFKKNNYDKWVLARDGEKALSDKVEPYIKRDASLLEVGDILVADGHKLAFNVINPFTSKPTRATLVGFLDWKSTALVGYEIMLEENTQCIASALRNSIINLDMIPKIVYQDNGRAFRAKYFTDDKGFTELGFQGLYSKLGIETVFARPYNARAKVIERFFKEFQEGFEKLLPSYVGSSIEKLAKHLKEFTLDEINMIAECDCKIELENLLNSTKIVFEQGLYKYKEKEVLLDYEIFTIPKKIKKSILTKTAINSFMKNYVQKNCKQGTVKNYNSIFKMHILPAFGDKKLNDISIEDIKSFYVECKNRNLCAKRIKNTLALLNQLLKYYQNKGIIAKKCVFQVKRLTNENKFNESRIVFE